MSLEIIETRIKKWHLYRNEIINEGILIDKVSNESAVTKHYKETIDRLNPKILNGISNNRKLARLISINNNEMLELKSLQKFIDLVDDKRLLSVNDEIIEWLSQHNNFSVLDGKENISQHWLAEDEDYNYISSIGTRIEICSNKWASFQLESKDQLVKIDSLEKNDNTKIILDGLMTIKPHEEKIGKFSQSLYIIPAVMSILFLLTAIILLVIKIGEL